MQVRYLIQKTPDVLTHTRSFHLSASSSYMKILLTILLAYHFGINIPYLQAQTSQSQSFRLPSIPDTLSIPEKRVAYLALHYWDYFDFTDTTLIAPTEITEQAFVDFVSILPYTPNASAAIDTLFHRALVKKEMLYHFISLGDKYLYEPNSPMHNEELYILILRALVDNPHLEEKDKIRPRHLLEITLKNRPGDVAADFTVTCRDGKRRHLSKLKANHILLYFNDPDCEECQRVKECLSSSPRVNELLESGRLKLFSVCIDGKTDAWEKTTYPPHWIDGYDEKRQLRHERVYDLKAMPTLYLLDDKKRVILKDTSVEQIETWFEKQQKCRKIISK